MTLSDKKIPSLLPEAELDILIVDDSRVDRSAIKKYLANFSQTLRFHEADWGQEGLAMMQSRRFDCVFLDVYLPDTDGVSILKKLYEPEIGLAPSPVVIMTGEGSQDVMMEALRFGAQDYFLKENMSPITLNIALAKAREMYELKISRHQAEQELQQARKLEAIGQLTSGVAHDFNNLLTVVLGNVHLLRRRLKTGLEGVSPEDISSRVEAIESVSSRGADLVRRLMIFTRQSVLAQEILQVNDRISDTTELLKRTLGANIEIQTILDYRAWPVFIDPGEFENMLINFAINARDAMPRGGKLVLETQNVILDDAYTLRYPNMTPGGYLMIAISDTGVGMSPEVVKRVFEPFFTTKAEGEGTGLGLSMAYGFVRQCNGHIHVYSEEGYGTVFRIYLPRATADGQADPSTEDAPTAKGRETILVTEDDETARSLAVTMLERLGYRTLQARNGRIAMELLRQDYRNINLVFTDIVMSGGMSGIDLAQYMRDDFPDVGVLLASGYTENTLADYRMCSDYEFISKPYRREALAKKIRKILDGGPDCFKAA